MSDANFNARLQRIALQNPAPPVVNAPPRPEVRTGAPRRPTGWLLLILFWFVFVPLGLVMRVMAQIYLELTSAAVLYYQLMTFVAISHLLLLCVSVLAALNYRRRQWLFWIALFTWVGYGFGAALLAIKDMG